ncbi:hypothetical protein LRE75_03235 [Streptomyces sp. 372A]
MDDLGRDPDRFRCAWCTAAYHQGKTPTIHTPWPLNQSLLPSAAAG